MDEQNKILRQVDIIIDTLKKEPCYQTYLTVQKEMQKDEKLIALLETIKQLQKQYIKSGGKNNSIKEKLDEANNTLESFPLYCSYMEAIDQIDQTLREIETKLNTFIEETISVKKNNT